MTTRRVLATGGSSGIGEAIARAFEVLDLRDDGAIRAGLVDTHRVSSSVINLFRADLGAIGPGDLQRSVRCHLSAAADTVLLMTGRMSRTENSRPWPHLLQMPESRERRQHGGADRGEDQ